MDGTLTVPRSCWVELHRAFGSDNDVGLGRYLRGEITDHQFMELDIRLWHEALGVDIIPAARVKAVLDDIPLFPQALEVLRTILRAGLDVIIITGGLDGLATRIIDQAIEELDIPSDEVIVALDRVRPSEPVTGAEPIGSPRIEIHANRFLVDDDGYLTGKGRIGVIARDKGPLLRAIMERRGIEARQVAAVGDGPVDIPLFQVAGLGIAMPDSRPEVIEAAEVHLSRDLGELLSHLGL